MTTTYDPTDPRYFDEADVRAELTRAFDLCSGCRRCTDLCGAFPTLFSMIDRQPDPDAGMLTPADQDRVVDACFHCKLCALDCPYDGEHHDGPEAALDMPRLMLRSEAMHYRNDIKTARERSRTRFLARTDAIGRVASRSASVANRFVGAPPSSLVRKTMAKATGVSAVRLLPPFAKQRFSTWFARRPRVTLTNRRARVAVYPSCLVEYNEPQIGHDLVKVYERNGIECTLSDAGCCGAPSLHAGHIDRFRSVAAANVARLAADVRSGSDVVVPQPTCSYVLKHEYPDHVGGQDAELVARHTFDAVEYLMRVHEAGETPLDTAFHGETVDSITYHAPCHLRAQEIGLRSRDLLKLTGARVDVVQQCSGLDGMWGLRAGNEDAALSIAAKLGELVARSGGDTVAGDCHLSNTVITEQTGREARHPLQIVARAYGIAEEV